MNIVVTGGAGFIGSHLTKNLLEQNHKIFIVTKPKTDLWRLSEIKDKIVIINNSKSELEALFSKHKINYIYHLASSYYKETDSKKHLNEMKKNNITFASMILKLAVKHNVKGFINTGTCFEYALSNKPINERSQILPYNKYAQTKISFEKTLKEKASNKKIKAVTLKLFYPYGEKDNPSKIFTKLFDALFTKQEVATTKGEQMLDYTYVSDIVDAYMKSLILIQKMNENYQVFNIGNDKTYSLNEIIKKLEKVSKTKILRKTTIPYAKKEIMYLSCDYSKAKKLLNWKPRVDIATGLKLMYKYYQTKYD